MKTLDSFILRAAIGLIFLLVNIVSVYLLLRGHNLPGGGFIGGLATGMSFILLGLALGWEELERALPVESLHIATVGLTIAIVSGTLPMVAGKPFLTHVQFHFENLPLIGELHTGTPLVFDIGVFLLVVGVTIKLLIVIARSTSGRPPFNPEETRLYSSPLEEPIEEQEGGRPNVEGESEEQHAA